ncbi:MAG: hypothetical protein AB7U98_03610 [Candidatus Nitrosocosmicus sp.]
MTKNHLLISIALFAVMLLVLSSSMTFANFVFSAKVKIGNEVCETKFGYRTCCQDYYDGSKPSGYHTQVCTTCWSDGQGGWHSCEVKETVISKDNAGPFTPQPSTGGIFQGDIASTPGPAAQDKPRSENTAPNQGTFVENLDFTQLDHGEQEQQTTTSEEGFSAEINSTG